jgi:NAD(P)-dependent dehydrogenase (short-subunit alcohol dehydrogenase family)
MTPKTWFITGASKGFGREWTEAALERGDRVAATARDVAALQPLVDKYGESVLAIRLDVTDPDAAQAAVVQAHQHFGSLDVVINNAGYGLFGMVEELTRSPRTTTSAPTCRSALRPGAPIRTPRERRSLPWSTRTSRPCASSSARGRLR